MSYRIRLEGELLVLQVYVPPKVDSYHHYTAREGAWRDATIHDIPIADPFARQLPERDCPKSNSSELAYRLTGMEY